MTNDEIINKLNQSRPAFLDQFDCDIIAVDPDKGICEMIFKVSEDYCHSGNVIQGGFVTAMLDAVSSHAVFVTSPDIVNVSTMELKVSFYAPSLAGNYKAIGKIEKKGYKTGFLSAELINDNGITTAALSSTSKIIRDPSGKY